MRLSEQEIEKRKKLAEKILYEPSAYIFKSIPHKKEVILKYREAIGKPLDKRWLDKQDYKTIVAIFYQTINGYALKAEKKSKDESSFRTDNAQQIELEDYLSSDEYVEMVREVEEQELMDELLSSNESYPTVASIRDKRPHMSDGEFMETMLDRAIANDWHNIPLELHEYLKGIVGYQYEIEDPLILERSSING